MHFIIILSMIIILPFILGIIATIFFGKKKFKGKVPGLLFHSILPGTLQPNLSCMSIDKFSKIIHRLKSMGYNSTTISNIELKDDNSTECKKIIITFDDGFQSIYDHALPILESVNFKVTVFCVTDFIGKASTWDVYGNSRHLDTKSIYKISQLGHEIGSHTCTHANLPYLSDKNLTNELIISKSRLEDITGRAVISLSFPHGSWNQRVWEIAQNVGYKSASIYRNHKCDTHSRLFPVFGIYQFDSPDSVYSRINTANPYSSSLAISSIIPHFAKGTPIWKFRKEYSLFPE